jgi:hypothetical protein
VDGAEGELASRRLDLLEREAACSDAALPESQYFSSVGTLAQGSTAALRSFSPVVRGLARPVLAVFPAVRFRMSAPRV